MKTTLAERFWEKVDKGGPLFNETPCWVWTACTRKDGYGSILVDRIARLAHRVGYELTHGTIEKGLTLDHLCRNRACVNPAHLEPVEFKENVLRGESFAATNSRKTTCPKGHALAGDNLYQYSYARICRTCKLEQSKRYYNKGK